ncbi:hypothetical protein GCM10025866_33600 [Naasia aerilata]|uniref:Uncharacterized protein n=2 Tax=Naasia aerilata TaxID=1162966 RepID=A0ABM8GGH5_9MICO|nr:hypothetical protein GCM10025866_33600 [Naasia aerilata]
MSYADEHFRTSDAVAHAVLRYAMLLAHGSASDVVRIPVLVNEEQTWAEIIVGPASQITTVDVPSNDADDELDDAEVVADLSRRADEIERARQAPHAQVEAAAPPRPDVGTYFDFPEV